MGSVGLCDHQQTGGVLVEPVDDPGTFDATNTGKVAAVVEEGVDEGPRRIAGRGMDYETGRFVDQQEIVVLEHDVERNIFRLGIESFKRRFVNHDPIPAVDGGGWFGRFLVEPDVTGIDQTPHPGSRPFWIELGETAIEAGAFQLRWNLEIVMGRHVLGCRLTHTWRPMPVRIKPREIS